jgi:nitroreductase
MFFILYRPIQSLSMDVITAIKSRRSVKAFDPNHEMTEFEIHKLIALAMLSPTAFNIQHWRFVIVRDPELRKRIRAASWNQAQITDSSLLVILCADAKSWAKNTSRYWRNAPQAVQEFLVRSIHQYYSSNELAQRDEAMRSCGIAAMTLLLAAKEMGYDSCAMAGFDYEVVGKLINLPEDHVISMFITIGKALKEPQPRGGQLPMSEVVIYDRFDRAHSHFPGHAITSERWELAICFNKFQRPAL